MIGYEYGQIGHRLFTARDAYHERRRRRAQAQLTVDEQFQLQNLMSRDNLYQTALSLKQNAGDAPGPNDIRLSELTPSELGAMAGELAIQIQTGAYKPHPRRAVPIEKPTGGTRILRIQDVEDKTVARRLKDALEPLIEPQFVEESFGFRPHRGALQMLARLKTLCDRDGLYALVVCDVQRAFDSVSVQEVMCAFVDLMEESKLRGCSEQTLERLRRLIATVLIGGNSNRSIGIDTGCPFSPLALNVLLHTKHDLIFMNQNNKPRWFRQTVGKRYADNLVYAAPVVPEGRQVRDQLRRHFLGINLPLKDDAEVYDLKSGSEAPILGFLATLKEGQLVYELPDAALHRLDERLAETHDKPSPNQAAKAALLGWVSWLGPALEKGRCLLPQAMRVMVSHGYRDVCSRDELLHAWEDSCQRWRELLRREERRESRYYGIA